MGLCRRMYNIEINAILLSELTSLNCSEISMYEKMHSGPKNIQNVLYDLLTQKLIVESYNNNVLQ